MFAISGVSAVRNDNKQRKMSKQECMCMLATIHHHSNWHELYMYVVKPAPCSRQSAWTIPVV